MSKHEPFAISLRPPSGLATPEFGPLVRAQPLSVACGRAMSLPRAQGFWRRRRLSSCPSWDGSGAPPGGVVRVTGRLRGLGEPFTPPGESVPAVYCRTRFPQANPLGKYSYFHREDIRGLFLEIDLSPDACVRVAPEAVCLLDGESVVPEVGRDVRWKLGAPWDGLWQGKLRRSMLRSGDMVEAVGEVVREVNPQGVAIPGRGVPMIQWLIPAWRGGVWIRRLEPA